MVKKVRRVKRALRKGDMNYDCTYVGIDPGKSGGIAVLMRGEVELYKMPRTVKDLWDVLHDVALRSKSKTIRSRATAMIELVHSSPMMGVKSAFTFGQGFGTLQMGLTAAGIPYEEVRPQEWLKGLKIPPRKKKKGGKKKKVDGRFGDGGAAWKNKLKAKAQALYPEVELTLGTSDALLIATYCMRKHEGTL